MTSFLVSINKLVYDSAMVKWSKDNALSEIMSVRPKKLPASRDTVGFLKEEKIVQIEESYDNGDWHLLPPIVIKQYGNTNYFEIIDGRHRVVVALKRGAMNINAVINHNH